MRWPFRVSVCFVFISMILTPRTAEARQQASLPGSFGLHGGVGAAVFAGGEPDTGWRPTFMVGIFYTPRLALATWQVEGTFQTKGSKITGAAGGTVTSAYLEFAGFLRINLLADRRTRVHFLVGPSAGWKAAAALHSAGQTFDLASSGRAYDVSLVAAAGVEINILTIEFRWSEGLVTTGFVFDGRETRNRVVTGLVGFRFGESR